MLDMLPLKASARPTAGSISSVEGVVRLSGIALASVADCTGDSDDAGSKGADSFCIRRG